MVTSSGLGIFRIVFPKVLRSPTSRPPSGCTNPRSARPAVPVTNYDYELNLEDKKRNINLLKPRYVNLVIDDLKGIMEYKKGSTQYVSRTLKRADNAKLYQ